LLEALVEQFSSGLPKFLMAAGILLAGWIVARLVARVVRRVLVAVKADRLTEKLQEIDFIQRSGASLKASVFLSKIIYYALMLIFIIAASDSLGLEIVSKQIADLLNYLPKFLAASIVFIAGILVSNLVKNAVNTAFRSLAIPSGRLISSIIFYFFLLTISITALEQAGMDTSFLTSNIQIILGGIVIAFAVGFGFSSRDILKNILASSYTKRKFQVGNLIRLGEYTGSIIEIDSTAVTLQIEDENGGHPRRLIIPQHEIINAKIEVLA